MLQNFREKLGRCGFAFMALALTWALTAATSMAQSQAAAPVPTGAAPAPGVSDDPITRSQVSAYDTFLDNHPEVAGQLRQNPMLIDNKQFVSQHPQLAEWLKDHPKVSEAIHENPRRFESRATAFDRTDGGRMPGVSDDPITRSQVGAFNQFLTNHPAVAQELGKNPMLIDNKQYVAQHPQLAEWLKDHPKVSEAIHENPRRFENREKTFNKANNPNPNARGTRRRRP